MARERLLACCEERPGLFEALSRHFSAKDAGVVDRIQKLHDRLAKMAAQDEGARANLPKIRLWLMTEAGLFRAELKAGAEKLFTTPDDAEAQTAFAALEKLDPAAAKAMLVRQAAADSLTARSTALLHLHAMTSGDAPPGPWRQQLQEIVANREAPGPVRAKSLQALHATDWPGKVEWVLALFADASLGAVETSEHDKAQPLAMLVKSAPDFWIPRIVPLVGNAERAVHDNAVRCLVQFHLDQKREDALRPLLPWLSDPKWARDDEDLSGRLRLLQTLDEVNLPESVPGVLWALEHDSEYALKAAASAAAHYQVGEAAPALRKAIEREARLTDRKPLAKSLLELDGLTLKEQARAVELYESLTLTKTNRDALEQEWMALPWREAKSVIAPDQRLPATAGLVLVDEAALQSPALAEALAARVEELRRDDKQDLAEALEARVSLWKTPASKRLLAARLRAGRVSAEWVWDLCSAEEVAAASLKAIQDPPPNAAAIIALLVQDDARIHQILDKGPPEAQAMLLACARLKRAPLPLGKVAGLLEFKHILCARAAERYLEAEDSPQARSLLQRRFKGEARILGARMSFDPGHHAYGDLDRTQDMLRQRVLGAKQPLEILALLSAGYWGDAGQVWIEISADKATLVNDQGGQRFRTRELTAAELAELRAYVSQNQIDDLPPLNLPVDDGIQYEYIHLSADGGRRVFMNNPGIYTLHAYEHGGEPPPEDQNDSVYVCLVKLFQKLVADKSKLSVAYRMADQVKGLKIVIPREQHTIQAVMAQGDVLIANEAVPQSRQGRWMIVRDGQPALGNAVGGPALRLHDAGFTEQLAIDDHSPSTSWRTAAAGGQLRATSRKMDHVEGLWICSENQEPRLIAEGSFSAPVASLDGAWTVMSRMLGSSWLEPNDMVRVNLATGGVIRVDLAPADDCNPVTRLPSGKILVKRVRNEQAPGIEPEAGPEKPEYHLLDPATGAMERVTGEFRPLEHETWRPLQPTGEPDVVWAALPQLSIHDNTWSTTFGRYDLRRFAFTKLMDIPGLYFTSMECWTDAEKQVVFLAINGDLLSFPLPPAPSGHGKTPAKR